MPRYQWNSGTIAQLESITNAPGKVEIILRPQKGANAQALTGLRESLGKNGMTNYVDADAQGDFLIIPVVKDEKKLLMQLSDGGWIQGAPTITQTSEDKAIKHDNSREKLQKHSLLASALFYDLGNVACMVSGYQRGRHNKGGKFTASDYSEMAVGGAFTAGDVLLTVYGKEEKEDPLLAFSKDLKQYLGKHNVVVPHGVGATPEVIHKSGLFSHANDFLKENVTSIKCLSETAGGLFMIKAAMKKDNFNGGKLAAGLMITRGGFPHSCWISHMRRPMRLSRRWMMRTRTLAESWGTGLGKTRAGVLPCRWVWVIMFPIYMVLMGRPRNSARMCWTRKWGWWAKAVLR